MTASAFVDIAPWYDALSGGRRRLDREGPFLVEALARAPGKKLLDLACGTGLHAFFLAEQGASVTAIDASESMIAYAQTHRSHPQLSYRIGDMRMPPPGPWSMTICLGNSLSLLGEPEEIMTLFRHLAEATEPGGRFIVQILNYAAPALRQHRVREETAEIDGKRVHAVKTFTPLDGFTRLHMEFIVSLENIGTVSTVEDFRLHHWTLEDLRHIAGDTGWREIGHYGAFDCSPYSPETSSDIIFHWKKA